MVVVVEAVEENKLSRRAPMPTNADRIIESSAPFPRLFFSQMQLARFLMARVMQNKSDICFSASLKSWKPMPHLGIDG